MGDFVAIDIGPALAEIDRLKKALAIAPAYVKDDVADAVIEYLLNVYRAYPPAHAVSRKAAYGVSFQSDKQRRWFFASLADGSLRVPYVRTQALAQAWRQIGKGWNSIIANENEAASWTMGPGTQSRHEMLVGWKDVDKINSERSGQIARIGGAAADKALRRAGL